MLEGTQILLPFTVSSCVFQRSSTFLPRRQSSKNSRGVHGILALNR